MSVPEASHTCQPVIFSKLTNAFWALQCSQSFTPLTIHHLVHNYQSDFQDAMGHPVKALLNTPPLSHWDSHFNIEGNQVGEAWFALFYWCDWVLPVSLSFMCLEMTFRRTLSIVLHGSDAKLTVLLFSGSFILSVLKTAATFALF